MRSSHEGKKVRSAWLALLVLSTAGCSKTFLSHQTRLQGCPIADQVFTTRQQTVVPDPVPAGAQKLRPQDVAEYQRNGYGRWHDGPGIAPVKRLDLMPAAYGGAPSAGGATLLNFFALTDIHISDKESPAQAVTYGIQWGIISGYSPAMLYTTHMLDAAVQTVNALHRKAPFDFGISLGDSINSSQYNELRWYIDVMDGKDISPDSGVKDDPIPGPHNDYQDPYRAAGLDKSIPWYQAIGNHDHFWMGMYPPDDHIKAAQTGSAILDQGNIFTDPAGIKSRGFYMGAIDGRTPYGDVVGSGPVAGFKAPPTVPADPNRRALAPKEWLAEFFKTSSLPVGHGFDRADAARGFACYAFAPKPEVPLKVIVLDDTQWAGDHSGRGAYGNGSLDAERYGWLVQELDKGQAQGQLMIIAAHVPIGFPVESSGLASKMAWSPYAAVTEEKLIAKLHEYPNLLLWIAGHRHGSTVTALKSPDASRPELGFWEVETPSLREFPQQFRTFEVVLNGDATVSVFATNVSPAVRDGSFAATARSYAIGAEQVFKMTRAFAPTGVYNAELVKRLSPEMQAKLSRLAQRP